MKEYLSKVSAVLDPVISEWEGRLQVPVVVAGGCIRDILIDKPFKDIDLFCLKTYPLSKQLENIDLETTDIDPMYADNAHLLQSFHWKDSVVQVMYRPSSGINTLLDEFDWNVCLFAYDGQTLEYRMNPEEIKQGGWLELQTLKNPVSALQRGFRFVERYGMRMQDKTLNFLCSQILFRNINVNERLELHPSEREWK